MQMTLADQGSFDSKTALCYNSDQGISPL